MKVLVTGFGPFRDVVDNPSARLVRRLEVQAGTLRADLGLDLVCRVWPVDWRQVPRLLAQVLRAETPDFSVHFGFSATARGFQLEAGARNLTCREADCAGRRAPARQVSAGAPVRLVTGVDLDMIERRLVRCGVPVSRSQDAGRYLCNYLYFQALRAWHMAGAGPRGAGTGAALFVHMPKMVAASGPVGGQLLREAHAVLGAIEILRACAAQFSAGRARRTGWTGKEPA